MNNRRIAPARNSRVYLAVLAALSAASNVEALDLRGSETLTISTDTTLPSLIVKDPSTADFVSAATLAFQYSGTPITLHANSFSTYVDNRLAEYQYPFTGPTLDTYTILGWGVNRTPYTSKHSESNLLNIAVDPALLGSATGVRFTASTINGVATSGLPSTYIIDQTIVNGREFATYDNDASDGRYGVVSATTANSLASASNVDNVFLTASETSAGPLTINSLALDQGSAATLGGVLTIETGRILFSSNSALNGNVDTGLDATVYVTGAGNQLNGQINAGNLTIDGGDGTVAELTVSAQQTASSVNLAEVNLNLTTDNVFQGADVYLMSQTGWTGFDGGPEQGSLDIGSTYQHVNSLVASDYGSLRLYGNGTVHAQERIAFASPGGVDIVEANLFSDNEMALGYGTFNGELRAQNFVIYGGDVYGDITDGVNPTNTTFDYTHLHGAKSYSGTTTVGKGYWTNHYPTFTEFGTASTHSSNLTLEDDAAITNSSDLIIYSSVEVVQDDASGVVNRLNDNMTVSFQDTGRLSLDGQGYSGDAYERVGDVSTAQGYGKLEAFSGASGSATFSVGNIEAVNNLLMVDTDANGHVLADSVNGDASDRLLKTVFMKAGVYDVLLGCDIGCDYATLDLPGFAEYSQGEIVAAQVDNININSATPSQLVHIDSSADGILTADRSVRGMILGGADGSVSNLSGTGSLSVGEGGILFWQDGAATVANDIDITNGGILRTFHTGQLAIFNGVMSGALDVAGPGHIILNNTANDFSALTLRGGLLDNFNSSRNDIDIQVTEGSHLRNATLGSGAYTGTLTVNGTADVSIAGEFGGWLENNGSATLSADRVGGYVRNNSGTASIRASDITGLRTDVYGGTLQIGNGGGDVLVDGYASSADLRSWGTGSIVVEDDLTVTAGSTVRIHNSGRQVSFNGVVENHGNVEILQNYNPEDRSDNGIHWALNNSGNVYAYGKVFGSMTNTANGSITMNGTNAGVIDNTAGGQLNITHLTNLSQVLSDEITTDGVVENRSTGIIEVTGTYTQNGGQFFTRGQVTANSMVINDGSVGIGSNSGAPDGVLQVTNALVQNGGSLTVDGDLFATTVELNGGTAILTGHGTIHADLALNGGQLNPGNSPGSLFIDGDYDQNTGSILLMEIGGLVAGTEHDALNISGTAYLGGTLDVDLYDLGSGLFMPSLYDSFDIMTAESFSGGFDTFLLASLGNGLAWDLSFLADEFGTTDVLRLSVVATETSPVPVPAALWLFGSGLLGLIGLAKRKKVA